MQDNETSNPQPTQTLKRPTRSIRYKVLGLVVLSSVVPAALVGVSSYWTARATLTEKLSEQLNSRASLTAARVGEWYQERRHDARIFGGSSMVVGRLEGRAGTPQTRAYLEEVKGRFGFYQTLAVIDREGQTVVSVGTPSAEGLAGAAARPLGSFAAIERGEDAALLWVSSAILAADGTLLGRFVMSCDFESLRATVVDEEPEKSAAERLRVSGEGGQVLFTHPPGDSADFPRDLPTSGGITETRDARGVSVLAAARAVAIPELEQPLTLTVATDADDAFASVLELRQRILLLSGVVVLLAVALGYGLVSSLTDPLERLAIRAQAVAHGDYASDLPVRSRDEIGYLTQVFNGMTANLHASHERLERLSVTDELTQLVNRRELRRVLEKEIVQSQRTGRPLSIVMLDLDHFKAYNDELGHIRGDELLTRLGGYLRSTLSPDAVAARYGGEEFLVLLPGTTLEAATDIAERVRVGFPRSEAAAASSPSEKVTLSLGVAVLADATRTPAKLIDAADQALYQAKRLGRDRVVVSGDAAGAGSRIEDDTQPERAGKDDEPRKKHARKAAAVT